MRRTRSRIDPLTAVSLGLFGIACVLGYGLVQSDRNNHTSVCMVHVKQEKALIAGHKKPASRRLVCDARVIALKDDMLTPRTSQEVFFHRNVIACSFDVVTNPFGLLTEQVDTESLSCTNATG